MIKPKNTRGDHTGYTQKVWLKEAMVKVHAAWVAQLPSNLMSNPPSCGSFRKMLPFYMYLAAHRHAIGCVCAYHAKWALLEAGLFAMRKQCHKSKHVRVYDDPCVWGETCNYYCACAACMNNLTLLEACVCEYAILPSLQCVLQECDACGIEKVIMCDNKEKHQAPHRDGKIRVYVNVKRQVPGFDDKDKLEPMSVTCTLQSVFADIRSIAPVTIMHDYMARRLANSFHHAIENLVAGEELWVMDYIENFSCFEEYALQQDHFSHKQVSIFVILCFRYRHHDEHVEKSTASLPPHITGELHTFLTSDSSHDAGFAQLCMMMVMQHKLVSGCVIKSLKLWTDGGPAHFKMYRQFLFLAMLADIYSIPMCWCFFQSCHGECHVMTCLLPHA